MSILNVQSFNKELFSNINCYLILWVSDKCIGFYKGSPWVSHKNLNGQFKHNLSGSFTSYKNY